MRRRYGRYEVLSKLGQGAMAQVFLARDPVLSRLVAVKVLHAELAERKDVLQRFFNEARTVALVRNPHVVEVFDFGREGGDLFLVMEFVDGTSLQGLFRRRSAGGRFADGPPASRLRDEVFQPLEAALAAALVCQAAEGLAVASRHGVVHRDIKPENLLINKQGYLKISDFGIAHVQDDSLTKTGAVLGSPVFMSPEQARGLKPITFQADMFSLGSVLYCCLAGHPPFRGRNIAELIRKIVAQPHDPLRRICPGVDPELASLVETLLRKEPSRRGGGPGWLQKRLRECLARYGSAGPVELVAGHVRSGALPASQSTWRMDARVATPRSGSTATEAFTSESKPRKPIWLLGPALALLVLAAAAGLDGGRDRGLDSGLVPPEDLMEPPDPGPGRSSASAGGEAEGYQVPHREDSLYPVAAPAVLSVRSSPPFADVFVDGRYMGVTPLRLELRASDRHRVVLRAAGVPDLDTVLSLGPGTHEMKLRLDFDALARMESEPDSAQ